MQKHNARGMTAALLASQNPFGNAILIRSNEYLNFIYYTERDSKIGRWQGGAQNLGQALAGAEADKPERFIDASGSQILWLPDAATTDFRITSGIPTKPLFQICLMFNIGLSR